MISSLWSSSVARSTPDMRDRRHRTITHETLMNRPCSIAAAMITAMCVALAAAAPARAADHYPSHPVTLVVPYTAGSQTDSVARLIGQYLQEALGQPFVIE